MEYDFLLEFINKTVRQLFEDRAVKSFTGSEVIGARLVSTSGSKEITSNVILGEIITAGGILEDGDVIEGGGNSSLGSDGRHSDERLESVVCVGHVSCW